MLHLPDQSRRDRYASFAEKYLRVGQARCGLEDDDPEQEPSHDADHARAEIRSWMKLFVHHFTAQRILEQHCGSLPIDEPIQIVVLGVGKLQHCLPSWDGCMSIVKSVISEREPQIPIDELIQLIETSMDWTIKRFKKKADPILFVTEKIRFNEAQNPHFTVHCEAALAAFASADERMVPSNKEYLNQLQKVCFISFDLWQNRNSNSFFRAWIQRMW